MRTWALCLVLAVGCGGRCPTRPLPARRMPAVGNDVLVMAPHPDDEVLGAAGLMAGVRGRGGRVHVVVVNDGGAGVNRTHAADLVAARREESRRAMARLGLPPTAIHFLGYPDAGLASAWSERWHEPQGSAATGTDVLEALRAELRAVRPTTIVLPLSTDDHPDHRALGRFVLLAVLAESAAAPEPTLLGYLIHGGRTWPACRAGAGAGALRHPTGCAGHLPWRTLLLGPGDVELKRALIAEYRTQLGRGGGLLRYAANDEPFASGMIVRAPATTSRWHPGVRRAAGQVVIRVPVDPCGVERSAGDRLRLRFLRRGRVEERLVSLDDATVQGGAPGALATRDDVRVTRRAGGATVALDGEPFADVDGAVLEPLPAAAGRSVPAWLLRW